MRQIITIIFFLTSIVCSGTETVVKRVIDGDTFEMETGEKVRLIGINAPEITDIFGEEAKQYLKYLIENRSIILEADKISNDRDRYNRLLRYVFLDGVDINKKMIEDGYAFAYLKYRFIKSSEYERTQLEARGNNKGIWGDTSKGDVFNELDSSEIQIWKKLTPKAYLVGTLVLIILLIGIFTYFRK